MYEGLSPLNSAAIRVEGQILSMRKTLPFSTVGQRGHGRASVSAVCYPLESVPLWSVAPYFPPGLDVI